MKKASDRERFKLAFLCFSRARGGLELMLLKIARTLHRRGHSLFFIAPAQSLFEDACRKSDIPFVPLTPRFKYLDPGSAKAIADSLKANQIDILLAGQSKDLSTCALARILFPNAKLVFLQQMQFGNKRKDPFHRWVYGHLDLWITLTEAMRKSVIENTVVPSDRIRVIPFGVDLSLFRPSLYKSSESRRAFGLPEKGAIVGLIGRLDKQKGQEYLLRAVPAIIQRSPSTHFALIGEETIGECGYLNDLKHIVSGLNVGNRVSFRPFTAEIPKFLAACDILTVPSFSETFGYVAIEAMAMEVPVIGTDAGGLPEIIEHETTGLLVRPKDSAALAQAVIRLVVNSKLRATMGKSARKRVLKFFDFARNMQELEEACSTLL